MYAKRSAPAAVGGLPGVRANGNRPRILCGADHGRIIGSSVSFGQHFDDDVGAPVAGVEALAQCAARAFPPFFLNERDPAPTAGGALGERVLLLPDAMQHMLPELIALDPRFGALHLAFFPGNDDRHFKFRAAVAGDLVGVSLFSSRHRCDTAPCARPADAAAGILFP